MIHFEQSTLEQSCWPASAARCTYSAKAGWRYRYYVCQGAPIGLRSLGRAESEAFKHVVMVIDGAEVETGASTTPARPKKRTPRTCWCCTIWQWRNDTGRGDRLWGESEEMNVLIPATIKTEGRIGSILSRVGLGQEPPGSSVCRGVFLPRQSPERSQYLSDRIPCPSSHGGSAQQPLLRAA